MNRVYPRLADDTVVLHGDRLVGKGQTDWSAFVMRINRRRKTVTIRLRLPSIYAGSVKAEGKLSFDDLRKSGWEKHS